MSRSESIVLEKYTGTWFQVATSLSSKFGGTGPGYYCVKAVYGLNNNSFQDVLTVHNEGFDRNGDFHQIDGVSYTLNESEPLKRKIKFDDVPSAGDYDIIDLGPIVDDKYDYAIVGSPYPDPFYHFIHDNFTLYVLTRNLTRYETNYRDDVKKWCVKNGFTRISNRYIETIRHDCPNYRTVTLTV